MTELATTSAPPTLTDHQMMQAKLLAASDLVPPYLRGKPANVYLILQYADALGIHPAHAISAITVISGKPTLSAELMRALVQRAGHRFHILDSTDQFAGVEVARREWPEDVTTFAFTMEDAKTAGLAGSDTYKKHPKAMLLARVTTMACRAVFADLLAGVSYDPDEIRGDTPQLAETRMARHTDNTPTDWDTAEQLATVVDITTGEIAQADEELEASVERHPANGDNRMRGQRTSPQATDAQLATIVKATRQMGLDPRQTMTVISGLIHRHVDSMVTLTKAEASQVITGLKDSTPVEAYVEETRDDRD